MSDETLPPVEADEKLDFKLILPIFVILLVDIMGLTVIIPLLPLYATRFGLTPVMIGLLAAAYPLMQFIGAPVLGRLSDRYGRKPVLVVSQIGTLVGFIMLALASSGLMLFLSRIIDGISGANIAAAQAAITDSTSEKTRTQGLGLIGAAFGIGFILGPILAFVALAATDNDYRAPALVAAVFSLRLHPADLVLVQGDTAGRAARAGGGTAVLFHPLHRPRAAPSDRRHPAAAHLCPAACLLAVLNSCSVLFTLSNLGFNASRNTIILVYVGIIVVAVQGYFIGRWSRRFGDRRLVYGGLALLSVGLLLLALYPRQPLPGYSQAALEAELSDDAGGETAAQDIAVTLPPDGNSGWLGLLWLLAAMFPLAVGWRHPAAGD